MSIVLAALGGTAFDRAVLETAERFGHMTGADVLAVSVRSGRLKSGERPESLAARMGVPFRLLEGPVAPTLLSALDAPEVIAAVIGARATPDGRRPVGRTAHHILGHAHKPLVVVPPEVVSRGKLRCLLVPLEGTEASSRAVLEQLCPLLVDGIELVVLHAFTAATVPAMMDRPGRDLDMLGKEFLLRHCPYSTRVELCVGPVVQRVAEASKEHAADLVVLSWSQDSSPGRARTVRAVLDASAVPVLLLPVASAGPQPADSPGVSGSAT